MTVSHELSEKIYVLPRWVAIGAASLGFAMAKVPSTAAATASGGSVSAGEISSPAGGASLSPLSPESRKANLAAQTETAMGRLAYRAYHDRRPGGLHMVIYPEGATAVWEFTEPNVPTRSGSEKGGEYIVDIVAPIAPGTSQQELRPEYSHINKLEVAEGGVTAEGPDGELDNGTILVAESVGNNARIADVTYAFNNTTPVISEAAAHPLSSELSETVKMERDWNNLGGQILTMAGHHALTGPLKQLWPQPADKPPLAF